MKKVVVVVGHSFDDKGAFNRKIKVHEYDFCMKVALNLFAKEEWKDIDLILKSRNKYYSELPNEINSLNPDYIIELHLNAVDNEKVQGTEHLFFHTSRRGKQMAELFQANCLNEFKLNDRGVKAIKVGERGNAILEKTKAPCIITEPFFLSNISESQKYILEDYLEKYIKYVKKSIREMVDKNI